MPEPIAVRLGDSGLQVEPERDEVSGPDEIIPGWGNTMRDGLGVRAERSGVEIAIVGGLMLDPVLGVRATSIGIRDGRIISLGRAGNPDTMDGIGVVLDTATAVFDARGLIVTPGGVDSHVHLLSPQVCDAALAGGLTTLVTQDWGPVWNLGTNPPEATAALWAAFDEIPLNVAMLVRASSSRPGPIEHALMHGGAGLKIHEDVGAGPEQIRCALDVADRHDVQLAIHTDGLNEALDVEDTYAAFGGRTVHAFHIEGAGGGHAPNLLELAGRDRVLTSSTTPTVPFGVGTEAEHLAMVPAVHVLEPGRRAGDAEILRHRVRAWTMAAESVLHDLGVIHMLSSDSQGMGRIGEVVRRAFQCADAMRSQLGPEPGACGQRARPALPRQGDDQPGHRARPRRACRLARDREAGRRGDVGSGAVRRPTRARPEGGNPGVGRIRRGQWRDALRRACPRPAPVRRPRHNARPDIAGVPRARGDRHRPPDRSPARGRHGLPRALGCGHAAKHPHRKRHG